VAYKRKLYAELVESLAFEFDMTVKDEKKNVNLLDKNHTN
jgi:hypothetical protein